jgi:cytochrome c-type biogenesis protein CcmF
MTDQVNPFNLRVRLRGEGIDTLLPDDNALDYSPLTLKQAETLDWQDLRITMVGVDKNLTHPNYTPVPGDIAIHGVLRVEDAAGRVYLARPLFYIRDGRPMSLKDFIPDLGVHVRLEQIDPATETFRFFIARPYRRFALPLEVALDAPRNDFIVLQAILFPGINLFWAGSLLMLLGLFVGMAKRLVKAKPHSA